jgi:hypothetical protein
MDSWIGVSIALVLLIGLWVPYYICRALGHTWFTSWKPRGHQDIGADLGGFRQTRPSVDDAQGARTDSGTLAA